MHLGSGLTRGLEPLVLMSGKPSDPHQVTLGKAFRGVSPDLVLVEGRVYHGSAPFRFHVVGILLCLHSAVARGS